MSEDQMFTCGKKYIIDLYDVNVAISSRLREESGGSVFEAVLKTVVADAIMYIFHGNQSHGERAIERVFEKNFISGLPCITITRNLFDRIYAALNVEGQHQLIGRYEYKLDTVSWTLALWHSPDCSPQRKNTGNSYLDLVDNVVESGGWVSEKIRRTINDARL
jgi:hypothetical protein